MDYDSTGRMALFNLNGWTPPHQRMLRMQKTPGTDPEGLSIQTPYAQSSPNPPAEKPVSASEELK